MNRLKVRQCKKSAVWLKATAHFIALQQLLRSCAPEKCFKIGVLEREVAKEIVEDPGIYHCRTFKFEEN